MSTLRSLMTLGIVLSAIAASGCPDRKPQQSAAPDAAQPASGQPANQPSTEHTTSPIADAATNDSESSADILIAEVAAAGIPAKYVAHFDQNKLARIDETRQPDSRRGVYEFYGARLVKYSGASFGSPGTLSAEFDLQGAVKSAQMSTGAPADGDISLIRDRAQLLRSHALAQRSVRAHSSH